MPRGKRFVWVMFMHRKQASLAAATNKYHGAARAFALPAVALERGEAFGECISQVGTRQ